MNGGNYAMHNKSLAELYTMYQVDSHKGLTTQQVEQNRKQFGENKLREKKKTPIWVRFLAQWKDFMILTLIAAACISAFVSYLEGNPDYVDAIIIFLIIFLNSILGVVQEVKAEKSIEALKKLTSPMATVRREGKMESIPAEELVPGDIMILDAGCQIPADGRLISSVNLKVEESSLTGESNSVLKEADVILKPDTVIAERKNLVFATTLVTYGKAEAIVTSTGMHTEVGKIAQMIMEDESPKTPLQIRLADTGKMLGIAALIICLVIFLIGIINKREILPMFMTSVSLAVAAIPEGLPAIVTIILSLGVTKMAKKHAVIRRIPAVETLGSATVICSDKTGTLTQNRMSIQKVADSEKELEFLEPVSKKILQYGIFCNDSKVQIKNRNSEIEVIGEPTDNAFFYKAYQVGIPVMHGKKRVYELPFDSKRKRMTVVYRNKTGEYLTITKGAIDFLMPLCSSYEKEGEIVPLTETVRKRILKQNENYAKEALRILGVSYKITKTLPAESQLEKNLVFLGMAGMIDPPRPEVKDAVELCKKAGIRPVMITGDHPATAFAIAKKLNIAKSSQEVITGKELSEKFLKHQEQEIYRYRVFARVSPENKVQIVKAFQKKGDVVAMTGDGINDAPALKVADIGCAMGETGTDVAKSAADMILTDDNFSTIVESVRQGRGIYENIRKSVHFLLSCNIGEIITIFFAIMFGLPTPLLAVQLLWVNLVTDSLPAIALGMEPTEKEIMSKKPIPRNQSIFSGGLMASILMEGIMIGFLSLLAFVLGNNLYGLVVGRTMAFSVLSLSQLVHCINVRSEYSLLHVGLFSNIRLLFSVVLCSALQICVVSVQGLNHIFSVSHLNGRQWLLVFLLSILPFFLVEMQKRWNRKIYD